MPSYDVKWCFKIFTHCFFPLNSISREYYNNIQQIFENTNELQDLVDDLVENNLTYRSKCNNTRFVDSMANFIKEYSNVTHI